MEDCDGIAIIGWYQKVGNSGRNWAYNLWDPVTTGIEALVVYRPSDY